MHAADGTDDDGNQDDVDDDDENDDAAVNILTLNTNLKIKRALTCYDFRVFV
jgi:hypothetical protein